MSNFKIFPLSTSEVEAVTMMSGYALLTGEPTRAVFPLSKINPENPHKEFNFRVKRIRKHDLQWWTFLQMYRRGR